MTATNGHTESDSVDLQERFNQLIELYVQEVNTNGLFEERLAELELALENQGWQRLTEDGEDTFSRDGLKKIIQLARMNYRKNPLISHAVQLQADYVMGQGLSVNAEQEDVNEVVQAFWDDVDNAKVLTSPAKLRMNDRELTVTGNRFFALFTEAVTGQVQVRSFKVDEIQAIITDPQDRQKVWFYHRRWSVRKEGGTGTETREAYYPDIDYQPQNKPTTYNSKPVMWEVPVYHMADGQLDTDQFGIPQIYPALDWARAVKEDLEDWASIRRAHSRFAGKLKTRGGKTGVTQARTKLGTTLGSSGGTGAETNPPPVVGSSFISAMDASGNPLVDYNPIKLAGMSPDPEDGRRLGLLVAAGVGIPETMLFGNADVGNLATAKTLDRPTELKFTGRQTDWETTLRHILAYVIDRAILAPRGRLRSLGSEQPDLMNPQKRVIVMQVDPQTGKPYSRKVDIDFPTVLTSDPADRVKPIIDAEMLGTQQRQGTFTDELLTRLLYQALGVDDIDEELALRFPEDEPDDVQLSLIAAVRELREAVVR